MPGGATLPGRQLRRAQIHDLGNFSFLAPRAAEHRERKKRPGTLLKAIRSLPSRTGRLILVFEKASKSRSKKNVAKLAALDPKFGSRLRRPAEINFCHTSPKLVPRVVLAVGTSLAHENGPRATPESHLGIRVFLPGH